VTALFVFVIIIIIIIIIFISCIDIWNSVCFRNRHWLWLL